jgi:hypothetical protein
MKLTDKVARSDQWIRSIELHDDAPVTEVLGSIREIERLARMAEKRVKQRRKAGLMSRLFGG